MLQQLKYFLGGLLLLPIFPILICLGKRLRAKIPRLPEAEGPNNGLEGKVTGKPIKILILGESTMAGVGVKTQEDGIAKEIARLLSMHYQGNIAWEVIAKSGYNAKQVHDELLPQMGSLPYDLIIIGLGVNDTVERNSPLGWKRDFSRILTRIRMIQACPIVLANRGPVEYFPAFPWLFRLILGSLIRWHWEVIQALPKQFPDFHIMNEVIELKTWQEKIGYPATPTEFFSDGVHPSKLTYKLWAAEIANFVIKEDLLKPKASL